MPPGTLALPGCPASGPCLEGGTGRVSAWVAPEESETQLKLWPRLPFLCQQDLELRTPKSWVPYDGGGGGGIHLDRAEALGFQFHFLNLEMHLALRGL